MAKGYCYTAQAICERLRHLGWSQTKLARDANLKKQVVNRALSTGKISGKIADKLIFAMGGQRIEKSTIVWLDPMGRQDPD